MCGIAGYLSLKKMHEKIFYKIIINMLKAIRHRGPDERHYVFSNKYAFGTNRLSIQSLKDGQQPIENDKYIVGFNGEIFNYFELLNSQNFSDVNSEVQLILKLFDKYKLNFVNKVKGQFAIYIYDKITYNS